MNTLLVLKKGFKVGKSTTLPQALYTANSKLFDVYTRHYATNGDSRQGYFRNYFAGAGAGGETFRVFSTVEAACTTVHGQHTSLSFGSAGSLSGLGVAGRHTLQLKAGVAGGTLAPTMSEISADAATSDASNVALHRFVIGGDPTGAALVDAHAFLLDLSGGSIAAGKMVYASAAADGTHKVRCRFNGTTIYLIGTTVA